MKRALPTLLILFLIIGGWGLFTHLQLWIPEGNVGVLRTNTSGVNPCPLLAGTFFWTWEVLIPGNVKTLIFPLKNRRQDFKLDGELPSGETYGAFLDIKQGFKYSLSGFWSARTETENLPELVAENLATPENWDQLLDQEASLILQRLRSWAGDPQGNDGFSPVPSSLFQDLKFWEDVSVVLTNQMVPDYELYRTAQRHYLETQELLQKERSLQVVENKIFELSENQKIIWLERYGKLTVQYPSLLELWKLAKDIPELKSLLPGVR